MKIVDVCAFYTPNGGGVRTYVDRKMVAGARLGHEILIVAPGEHDHEEARGPGARIRWLRSPKFPLDGRYRYFADRAALHDVLRIERPEVIEVSSPWRSATIVADLPGEALKALIAHADPLSAYAYRWFDRVADRPTIDRAFNWYWRHLRRLDQRFDLIVSASADLSSRLKVGGLNHVTTIPMGVDPGRFSPSLRDQRLRRDLLARCLLPESAFLLLGIGRHAPEKRWDVVIEAASVAGATSPVGLVIIGDGHASRKVVSAVDGSPHVQLLAPVRDRDLLARIMASADALLHGCEAETFCLAAAEAAASGVRIIAPDRGGAADIARASDGILYRSGSSSAAAAAVATAISEGIDDRRTPRWTRTMDDHFRELLEIYASRISARRAPSEVRANRA